ncbi:MAG: insulinase family protein, partial [Candidatus Cloacimonetes bacterium]|nr:insulinase family protein [Candidatus Cloacimonadota bacterium]
MNLMKVYLDAVFFPNIYTDPNILHQEGWHYELLSEDGEISYRGVVYNEMKGAFSSTDSIIARKNMHAQFPDSPYGFESGGDPEAIPELSYENFLQFHRKYYHPSNSKIALYGDLDLDAAMQLLDSDYLSHFSDDGQRLELPLQKPFAKQKVMEIEFPVDEHKDITDQYYLALNWTYGKITDPHLSASLDFLWEILMQTPASPLKKALRDSGLVQDSSVSVDGDLLQPTVSLICKQIKKENIEPLLKLIKTELKRLVNDGIDKKLIESVLNRREFVLREAQLQRYPKGLYYIWLNSGVWMHGGDPIQQLGYEKLFTEMRKALSQPLFENLIETTILNNKHSSQITYIPVPGLIARQDAETAAKLAAYKDSLTPQQKQELVEFNAKLKAYQEEPEKAEDLEKIPLLSLDDLNPKAPVYPLEVVEKKDYTLLKHETQTNGIVYLKAYFDLAHAEEEDMPWIKMYAYLTHFMNSQNYGFAERSNEIGTHTGGVSLSLELFNSYQTPDDLIPKFVLSGKAVKAKTAKLIELATDYALNPKFDDPERIKTLIRELKAKMEASITQNGMGVAIVRMLSPLSQIYHLKDLVSGLGYHHFLSDLVERLDADIYEIIEELDWVKNTFFTTNNLILSLTGGAEEISVCLADIPQMLGMVSHEAYEPVENHYHLRNFNEAISAPVKVQFCAKGGNFFRKGYSYSGKLRVLNSVISNNFLHQELRVKGGAYGAMSQFSPDGYQYF